MNEPKKITVDGLARLPTFCHAVVAGDFVFVSGTLGTSEDTMTLVEGGVAAETRQAMRHIERILAACGATLDDLVKVNVYLRDISDFAAMNEAYLAIIGADPPARITVGRSEFALSAAVEIDAIAYVKNAALL